MSEPYTIPLPKQCVYSHIADPERRVHYCHAQWTDPQDPVPYNVSVEWYGPRCSTHQLEDQAYLKMLNFLHTEHDEKS